MVVVVVSVVTALFSVMRVVVGAMAAMVGTIGVVLLLYADFTLYFTLYTLLYSSTKLNTLNTPHREGGDLQPLNPSESAGWLMLMFQAASG